MLLLWPSGWAQAMSTGGRFDDGFDLPKHRSPGSYTAKSLKQFAFYSPSLGLVRCGGAVDKRLRKLHEAVNVGKIRSPARPKHAPRQRRQSLWPCITRINSSNVMRSSRLKQSARSSRVRPCAFFAAPGLQKQPVRSEMFKLVSFGFNDTIVDQFALRIEKVDGHGAPAPVVLAGPYRWMTGLPLLWYRFAGV